MKRLSSLSKINLQGSSLVVSGKVIKVIGLLIEADGPLFSLGTKCYITNSFGLEILSEIVGFKEDRIILMPYGDSEGIALGNRVVSANMDNRIRVGDSLLGRILDGLGDPYDNLPPIEDGKLLSIYNSPPPPLARPIIKDVIETGVRAIDGVLTMGNGQRMGIFAGSGVGKSVLLGMIARNTSAHGADVNVIALIGERGREVREFIERDLGAEGIARSVVIVATSDTPPIVRRNAPFVATTIAEYFAYQGKKVMLMMDSLTRFAMAQREIGLAVGEPPTTRGYPASSFAAFPKLLERAGTINEDGGAITALYTVLVEGDDVNDPVGDTVRSIIDGHIVLDRRLAARNHFPAIDILLSASRLMRELVPAEQFDVVGELRDIIFSYNQAEDLINIGAYVQGSNPRIDRAVQFVDNVNAFLRQRYNEGTAFGETVQMLYASVGRVYNPS